MQPETLPNIQQIVKDIHSRHEQENMQPTEEATTASQLEDPVQISHPTTTSSPTTSTPSSSQTQAQDHFIPINIDSDPTHAYFPTPYPALQGNFHSPSSTISK